MATNPQVVSSTLASIYNIYSFHLGSFTLAQFLNYFNSGETMTIMGILRVLGMAVVGMILVLITVNIVKTIKFVSLHKASQSTTASQPTQEGALGSRWEEVQRHLNSTREAEWKFSVIEADKLVDDILKSAGFVGDTMGDRLMNITKERLVSIDDLWEAHKIRNRLAHDPNYFLRYGEAKRAIQLFEKTLQELNAI